MSWQPYIDDQLLAKGFMHAAIVSHGGSLWAASEDFFVHPSEVRVLVAALVPPSDPAAMEHLATRGFTLNEVGHYALTRADVSGEDTSTVLASDDEDESRELDSDENDRLLLLLS